MRTTPSSSRGASVTTVCRYALWCLGALIVLSQLYLFFFLDRSTSPADAVASPLPQPQQHQQHVEQLQELAGHGLGKDVKPLSVIDTPTVEQSPTNGLPRHDREPPSTSPPPPRLRPSPSAPSAAPAVAAAAVAAAVTALASHLLVNGSGVPYENHVFVYQGRWREAVAEAKAGGPAGELFMFDTAEKALLHLQRAQPELRLRVHKLQNRTELDSALSELQAVAERSAHHRLIGLYTQVFDLVTDNRALEHGVVRPCVYRWLDFWGTPPEQNHIRHHLLQFLTPYRLDYNGYLGFIVALPSDSDDTLAALEELTVDSEPPPKFEDATALSAGTVSTESAFLPRLCLWGKMPKYFTRETLLALQSALESLPPSVTRPTVHGTVAGNGWTAPAWLHNHGVQSSSAAFHRYLSSCTLLVGLGDPILGPTVFQAVAHGARYLNFDYGQSKTFWMNGRMRVRTQHDEAAAMLGPQWVTDVRWDQSGRLRDALAQLLQEAEQRWRDWRDAGGVGEYRQHGFVHPDHRLDNVAARVRDNLFNADICPAL